MAARVVALTLVILVARRVRRHRRARVAIGRGEGGGGATQGPEQWGVRITGVIDGISVLFSQPPSVRSIKAGDSRVGARLAGYDEPLPRVRRASSVSAPRPLRSCSQSAKRRTPASASNVPLC
jgi:hypothetical protein